MGSKDAFSRVFLFQPADDALRSTRGEIFAIFSVAVSGLEIDWERTAIQAFNHLRDTYFDSSAGSVLAALEEALESTKADMHAIIAGKLADVGRSPVIDLHIGALVVWGGTFVFRSSGRVYFSLFRNNELIDLSQDRFVQEAIQDQDALVLGTSVLGERIGTTILQKILQSELSDDWQQSLRDEVKDVEESALLSGLILSISIKTQPAEEEVIELVMPGMPAYDARPRTTKLPLPDVGRLAFSLKTFFARIRMALPLRSDVYLRVPRPGGSVKRWIIVFVLLALLVGSVYGTYRYNQRSQQQEETAQAQEEITNKLQRVQEIALVDRAQAQRAFDALQGELGSVQGVATEQVLDVIYATTYVEGAGVPVPVQGGSLLVVPRGDGIIGVLPQQGAVVAISEEGTFGEVRQLHEMMQADDVAAIQSGWFTYSNERGVWYTDFDTFATSKIIEQTGQWGQVSGIATYMDNLYITAHGREQVFRYIGLGNGQLGGATNYMSDPVSYAQVVDIAIDGYVYLLHENGTVEKFLSGRRTDFSLHGVMPPMSKATQLITYVDAGHVYLLADNSVLVFTTDGTYVRRYKLADDRQITTFGVTTDESHLFLVAGDTLFVEAL